MLKKFDNQAIEKKWQAEWKKNGAYDVGERKSDKEKAYVLVEWPYPSGNLHIGHWHAFAVPDIYVRYLRMTGKQVLYPMGFDAFGLPAENAAIKHKLNPREWTEQNMSHMRSQLDSMGAAFSWDKTTSSIDPDYYKWTQWMFTQFFENDIAYRGSGVVNWCPHDNTVIANEQVTAEGECERCGNQIEKKDMPQWMLRITKYANRLIDDLDNLDWPEQIKEAQRRWIGRSEGADIDFKLSTGDTVTVFTTRPDTLYGATYMVLAPEHALLEKNKSNITNWDEVIRYIELSTKKDEQDRLDATKEKTGVKLEGITATNPANGEEIPVFIADYVLASYGTGAIMAVPAHDERDRSFAELMDIEIRNVIKPDYNQPNLRKYFSGPIENAHAENETLEQAIQNNREATISAIQIGNYSWTGPGTLLNSREFNDMSSEEAKIAITKKVGGRLTSTYRLRDWSIGRQRYWGVPIPIVYDPEGKPHAVPKEHLPWKLPEDVDFTPTGEPPLAKSQELKDRTEQIFGADWTPEVETMDTFVDSSWYFLRYLDTANNDAVVSEAAQKNWMPIDVYFGGAEHTTMHLLYSRFWQKALYDLKLVTDSEPYKRRYNRGLILGPDGNKMSKSKGNVIDPDEHVKTVGADTVKMYLAFMGPYAEVANYPWDMGGIAGIRRFLERVNGLHEHLQDEESEAVTKQLHKTIKKVTGDIVEFKFNTAISSLMMFVNLAEKEGLTQTSYETFLRALAPFAPHLTEELWSQSHSENIHSLAYPDYEEALTIDSEVTIGVQINGKMRGQITLAVDASEAEALKLAAEVPELEKRLTGEISKVIYVPGRILNMIVKE